MDDLNLEPENAEFGQYLRSVRQAKKISIRQLAKAVSKTPTYISDIERVIINLPKESYWIE